MCGIVGAAGNLNTMTSRMFRDMLIFDQVRGMDSTGIAFVGTGKNDVTIEKEIGCPDNIWNWAQSNLLDFKGVSKHVQRVMLGHNRAATMGKAVVANAHPFQFDHITGVHNGTLTTYFELEGSKEFDVDSQALINTIAKKGIDYTWKSFYGAAAIVYWDEQTGDLNFIRNNQRDLFYCYSMNKDVLFWASEGWMISIAAARNNVSLQKDEETKRPLIKMFEEDTLYTYTPTAINIKEKEVRLLEKKKVEPYTNTQKTTNYGGETKAHGQAGHFKGNTNYTKFNETDFAKKLTFTLRSNWTEGYERAAKELVGSEFTLRQIVDLFLNHGERSFYMLGHMKNGDRVEIYPTKTSEYSYWRGLLDTGHQLTYKLNFRPRVKSFSAGINNYRVSSACVSLVSSKPTNVVPFNVLNEINLLNEKQMKIIEHKPQSRESTVKLIGVEKLYKSFNMNVTERRWNELMKSTAAGCACSICGNPLSIEQHRDIEWVSEKFVMCEMCKEDPTVLDYIHQYAM